MYLGLSVRKRQTLCWQPCCQKDLEGSVYRSNHVQLGCLHVTSGKRHRAIAERVAKESGTGAIFLVTLHTASMQRLQLCVAASLTLYLNCLRLRWPSYVSGKSESVSCYRLLSLAAITGDSGAQVSDCAFSIAEHFIVPRQLTLGGGIP